MNLSIRTSADCTSTFSALEKLLRLLKTMRGHYLASHTFEVDHRDQQAIVKDAVATEIRPTGASPLEGLASPCKCSWPFGF